MVPLITTGDGNCLFNAVSRLLVGHEGIAKSLRLAATLHAAKHAMHYVQAVSKAVKCDTTQQKVPLSAWLNLRYWSKELINHKYNTGAKK